MDPLPAFELGRKGMDNRLVKTLLPERSVGWAGEGGGGGRGQDSGKAEQSQDLGCAQQGSTAIYTNPMKTLAS